MQLIQPKLAINYNKKHSVPQKLTLQISYEERAVAKTIGQGTASWSKLAKLWCYPVDPVIVRNAKSNLSDLVLSDDLKDYLVKLKQHQLLLQEVIKDESLIQPYGDTLYPFQRASIRFLEHNKRCVLGHKMGTGKTVITTTAINHLQLFKVLIVCPNSVKFSWSQHSQKWAKRPDIYILDTLKNKDAQETILFGSTQQREDKLASLLQQKNSFILIINYAQLRIHRDILNTTDYDAIIFDEAHHLKNRKAEVTKAAFAITKKSNYVWLLTGTPIRNNYTDLWAYLHIVDPIRFKSFSNFVKLFLKTVPSQWGIVEDVVDVKNINLFNSMLATYIFAKTKEEVLPQLPKLIKTTRILIMSPIQQKFYNRMEKEFAVLVTELLANGQKVETILQAPTVVAQLIRLRQICLSPALLGGPANSAKLDALIDLFAGDLKTTQSLIFTYFRRFIPFITQLLRNHGVSFAEIVGGQTPQERENIVQALNRGDIQVIVGTIASMGEGMNLQAASTAIFCDRFWVPAINEQAEERIHRGGIKTSPVIIDLYHPKTVEADVRATCKRKSQITNQTIGQIETIRNLLQRV